MNNSEIIFLIEEDPDGGYNAKALGYSIFTQSDSWEELEQNIKEATHLYFEEKDSTIPKIIRLHFVKEKVISN